MQYVKSRNDEGRIENYVTIGSFQLEVLIGGLAPTTIVPFEKKKNPVTIFSILKTKKII